MTLPISNIVKVQITRDTLAVSKKGFGLPLVVGPNGNFGSARTRTYSSLSGVAMDFSTTDPEYKASTAIFSQQRRVKEIKIGVQATKVAMVQTIEFDIDFVASNVINGKVGGVAIAPVIYATSHTATLTALAVAIQASSLVSTATVTGARKITITAKTVGIPCMLSDFVVTGGASQATATIATVTQNHGIQEDLNEIQQTDDNWYGLIFTERAQSHVELAAEWILPRIKMFITASNNIGILDSVSTSDIAYQLKAKNNDRTAVMYNADPDDFIDAAWMGYMFSYDPGRASWHLKNLSGVVADNLTQTQFNNARAKNANLFVTFGGIDVTQDGRTAKGEYLDIVHGIDWLQARIEEVILEAIIENEKIPYTNGGTALIENPIRAVLGLATQNKLLSDEKPYQVSVPDVATVSKFDKANRLLPDIKFNATFTGAVHNVEIEGIVSL